jgi:hypothetical protein
MIEGMTEVTTEVVIGETANVMEEDQEIVLGIEREGEVVIEIGTIEEDLPTTIRKDQRNSNTELSCRSVRYSGVWAGMGPLRTYKRMHCLQGQSPQAQIRLFMLQLPSARRSPIPPHPPFFSYFEEIEFI